MTKNYLEPPRTVAKAKAEMTIIFDNERGCWVCEITPGLPGRSVSWRMKPGYGPGTLLNKAARWAIDRGLDLTFISATITKQEPNEHYQTPSQ